jgi:hypothetical protein
MDTRNDHWNGFADTAKTALAAGACTCGRSWEQGGGRVLLVSLRDQPAS